MERSMEDSSKVAGTDSLHIFFQLQSSASDFKMQKLAVKEAGGRTESRAD